MARSIPFSVGFADTLPSPTSAAATRSAFARLVGWLTWSGRDTTDREIAHYLVDLGVDHLTDSIEREIEYRFIAPRNGRI
jgi:hypothetical protein